MSSPYDWRKLEKALERVLKKEFNFDCFIRGGELFITVGFSSYSVTNMAKFLELELDK